MRRAEKRPADDDDGPGVRQEERRQPPEDRLLPDWRGDEGLSHHIGNVMCPLPPTLRILDISLLAQRHKYRRFGRRRLGELGVLDLIYALHAAQDFRDGFDFQPFGEAQFQDDAHRRAVPPSRKHAADCPNLLQCHLHDAVTVFLARQGQMGHVDPSVQGVQVFQHVRQDSPPVRCLYLQADGLDNRLPGLHLLLSGQRYRTDFGDGIIHFPLIFRHSFHADLDFHPFARRMFAVV